MTLKGGTELELDTKMPRSWLYDERPTITLDASDAGETYALTAAEVGRGKLFNASMLWCAPACLLLLGKDYLDLVHLGSFSAQQTWLNGALGNECKAVRDVRRVSVE